MLLRTLALLTLLGLLPGCAGGAPTSSPTGVEPQQIEPVRLPSKQVQAPDVEDGRDWILLDTGEWLAGTLIRMRRGDLEFDSDNLGEVTVAWGDVQEMRVPRSLMMAREGREDLDGALRVVGDEAFVTDLEGTLLLDKSDLLSIVPSRTSEWDYWSGEFTYSLTARTGNTEQVDTTAYGRIERESTTNRWLTAYNGSFSEVQSQETANTQRANSRFDVFLTPRLFLTPVALEYFRDPFQNVDRRVSGTFGAGYELVEEDDLEIEISPQIGWRETRFADVPSGRFRRDGATIAVLPLDLDWDVASGVDFSLTYQAQVNLENTEDVNHNLRANLSLDLVGDLDLDVSVFWDRIGRQIPDLNGVVPEADDLRVTVGISYSF